ncbi:MAG: AIPR family protein [Acidobacteriaceae bacterium]
MAKIVLSDKTGTIFESNIRRFLGTRGAVNSDIVKTCTDTAISHQFWFLNNGITILCDSFDPVTDPDNAHVKIKNMQIVNGCQTASALALAETQGKLALDTRVMLRIYEADDAKLGDKIVLTTNNQNKISSRDLRANDKIQVDMQEAFLQYGLYYERKVSQYGPNIPADRIIVNESVAQSYLGIVLKKPSDARRRKYKVWGEMYERIFSGLAVEPYVVAVLLTKAVYRWLENSSLLDDKDDLRRKLANNGVYHIARAVAYIWRGSDNWNLSVANLKKQIKQLETSDDSFIDYFQRGFYTLEEIVRSKTHYLSDVDTALKSGTLDSDLDKALNRVG